MSERTKDRLLSQYLIFRAVGVRISDSFQAVIDRIQNERAAGMVARKQEARA